MRSCHTVFMPDVMLEFIPKMGNGRAGRVDQGRAHRAEGAPVDAIGQFQGALHVARRALTVFQPVEGFVQAGRAHPTGDAASARFVGEKFGQAAGGFDHAGRFIHHYHSTSSQFGTSLFQGFEGHRHIQRVGRQHRRGGPAGDDGLDAPFALDSARVFVDDFAQGHAERQFVVAGALDMPADRENLGAFALGGADACEPLRAARDDVRDAGQGLDVVNQGWQAEQPRLGRVGWFQARIAGLALQRFEHGGLLAADIRARAAMDGHFQAEPAAEDVLPQEAVLVGVGDGLNPAFDAQEKLAANVNIRPARADGISRDDDALDDLVRVALDDFAVFEGAGFALVGVDRHHFGQVRVPGQEAPFDARRESRAAPSAQAGAFDHFD